MKELRLLIQVWLVCALLVGCDGAALPTFDVQEGIEATVTALLARTEIAGLLASRTPVPLASATPSPTPLAPDSPPAGIPATAAVECIPPDTPRQIGLVTGVIDGDTIDVLIDGRTSRVRYIGVDAPEPRNADPEVARMGELSAGENSRLVNGEIVTLVRDVSETDRFGRLLRYVFVADLNGTFVNLELVRIGYAWASDYPPDIACSQPFHIAEVTARQDNLGLWEPNPGQMLTEPAPLLTLPVTTTQAGAGDGNCDAAYPDVCIPPPPPDLDCQDIQVCNFRVLPPDPHFFDGNADGMGCESCPEG